jgi:hypothetical protein
MQYNISQLLEVLQAFASVLFKLWELKDAIKVSDVISYTTTTLFVVTLQ